MPELPTTVYEPYVGELDNGQQILVQIFRDLESGHVIDAQVAFRAWSWDTWGIPTPLKVAPK
jgi:hypothetical protein